MRRLIAALLFCTGAAQAAPFALGTGSIATRTTGQDCPTFAQDGMTVSRCLNITASSLPSGTFQGATAAVANSTATAKVTSPSGTSNGTIVCMVGGDGGGMCSQYGTDFVGTLNAQVTAGKRVILLLQNAPKWGAGTAGFIYNSARVCTQLKAIKDDPTLYTAGTPYQGWGQSGGASALAFCMAFFGAGDWFDQAIFSSGPPHTNMYYGLVGTGNSAWATFCAANTAFSPGSCIYATDSNWFNATAYGGDGAGAGTYTAFVTKSACGGTDSACTRDSIQRGNAVLDYPQTDVQFIFGDRDSSSAVPIGRLYKSILLRTPTETVIAQAVGHNHTDVPNDAAAALATIFAAATFRH
jgi:hypothetical protein